jgi:acyl-coenzyme A synthetase/AMP-(fatty) acid ligase
MAGIQNSAMHWFEPARLEDLELVFSWLEAGDSVCLASRSIAGEENHHGGPALGLTTSGTTGKPRVVWHAWDEIRSQVSTKVARGWTWASPFRAGSFAGVQVALQAWATGGDCLNLKGDWSSLWEILDRVQPDALCCTPTFLDLLLLSESAWNGARRWSPQQITLGGEPLRRRVGQLGQTAFPAARVTLVYASAELGVIAKSHGWDGWFDLDALTGRRIGWRLDDSGELLEVQNSSHWHATGDRVEVEAGRFRILGRAGHVANVGGVKVSLAAVEAAAVTVPGVQAARAWAVPNPLTGHIVGLRFSVLPGSDPSKVVEALGRDLRRQLPREAHPRRIEVVSLELGPNAKQWK